MDKNQLLEAVAQELDKYRQNNTLEKLVNQVSLSLQKQGMKTGTYKITSRYKSIESISEKIDRKGYTDLSQITDLMGIKVVSNDEKSMDTVKSIIDRSFTTKEVKNYYEQPRPDGYKSLHMLSETPKSQRVEFQVKDITNDLKQRYCHFRIYKNPEIDDNIKPEVNRKMNQYLDKYFTGKRLTVADKLSVQDIQAFDGKLGEIMLEVKLQLRPTSIMDEIKKAENSLRNNISKAIPYEKER